MKSPIVIGEMTYLVLVAITAALMVGILALPLTLPTGALIDARAAVGSLEGASTLDLRPSSRLI
ncbi:hypothetical protein [Jannaschia seohaensis]|nr:hypothetical protein [Jannaschia seohaensis]